MTDADKPSSTKRIVFLVLFIIGLGMFFVSTAGPLSGPAMSWDEAALGLVPGALLMTIGHVLHKRALVAQQLAKKAAIWGVSATVFLIGLGGALIVGGQDKAKQAKRELDDARAEQRARMYDPYSYGGGYDNTSLLERDVEHYKTATNVGYGIIGLSVLFAIGAAMSMTRSKDA